MKIAIHQPNFLPWRGYFDKINKADVFVLLDNAQYTKNSFINRNKIKTAAGVTWLGLPVKKSSRTKQLISDIELYQGNIYKKKLLKTISANYSASINFEKVYPSFSDVISNTSEKLIDINCSTLDWALSLLGNKTKVILASTLDIDPSKGTDRLVSICKCLNAQIYLSGTGGTKYQEENKFELEGIELQYQDFQPMEYPQLWGKYLPNLSIIDFLFNGNYNTTKAI